MAGTDAEMLSLNRGNMTRVTAARDAAEIFGGLTAAGQPKLIADRVVIDCPSTGDIPGARWEELGSRKRGSDGGDSMCKMLLVGAVVLGGLLLMRA